MAVDAEVIGRRLAEARDRAGLTQAELADRIALARSSLAKIEGGSRRVTAIELARLAEELGTRIEWFLEDAPKAIVSRRNAQDPGAPSPEIDLMIERVARAVEFVSEHSKSLQLSDSPERAMPRDRHEAEELAESARAMLGVHQEGVLTNLVEGFADLGLLSFSFDLGRESADAAMILLRSGGVAIINGDRRVGRRRLALAHELGHFLVADEYYVDWRVAETPDTERREGLLDHFARALLLPRGSMEKDWRRFNSGPEGGLRAAAVRMASIYRVDMATLARRLRELEIVGSTDARKIREVRTTRVDIVDFGLVVARDELASPVLPLAFERAVLGLYRDEIISSARAMDLFFGTWEEGALPPLDPRAEGEIWQFV
ncbi:helix-turn-helix domain-containing protein [Actinomadura latina]|uniref:Helix-turn-helix domain-containing protein n=1 Tax=Actinomadura latina TaxID=163603 RepID=A0A846Z430_9ACTN|nr:XRE family transcriptional regulator [Actinomadura latina]NKZ07011.1 helix-turn-helix domain-containing protein [Actinomadura latina]